MHETMLVTTKTSFRQGRPRTMPSCASIIVQGSNINSLRGLTCCANGEIVAIMTT